MLYYKQPKEAFRKGYPQPVTLPGQAAPRRSSLYQSKDVIARYPQGCHTSSGTEGKADGKYVVERSVAQEGVKMQKSIKKAITVFALCALLVSMAIPTAFAGYATSTATVNFGSTDMVTGGDRTLYGTSVSGSVKSTTSGTSTYVTGYLYTKGSLFSHARDSANASNYGSKSLYWANSDAENGTFWAACQATGDHSGYCKVTQTIPDTR